MKTVMVMPALLLKKPHPQLKAKEHALHLDHCLQLWRSGELKELLLGHTIQRQLK